MIQALAVYEKLSHEVLLDPDRLSRDLFGPRPYAEVLIAEAQGRAVGFALFFHNYSTFVGKPGIWLEDLFVLPEFRGQGHGKQLLLELARIARQRDCGRLEWAVLDWNQPSIDFYESLGAKAMNEWTTYRLDENGIKNLSSQ
jgi:GNAT superfamily N-acetyltransferase